jgi:hypothetical protein
VINYKVKTLLILFCFIWSSWYISFQFKKYNKLEYILSHLESRLISKINSVWILVRMFYFVLIFFFLLNIFFYFGFLKQYLFLRYQLYLWIWLLDQTKILRGVSLYIVISQIKILGYLEFKKALRSCQWYFHNFV